MPYGFIYTYTGSFKYVFYAFWLSFTEMPFKMESMPAMESTSQNEDFRNVFGVYTMICYNFF